MKKNCLLLLFWHEKKIFEYFRGFFYPNVIFYLTITTSFLKHANSIHPLSGLKQVNDKNFVKQIEVNPNQYWTGDKSSRKHKKNIVNKWKFLYN